MAKRVINCEIEFAFASQNIDENLKCVLEKFFLYQNILIVDSHYEFGGIINKLEHNTRCKFEVCRNFKKVIDLDNFDCIIVVNSNDIDKVKQLCYEYSIPYIVALTKLCDGSVFKKYYFSKSNKIKPCNYPLGIFLDLDSAYDARKFVSNAIIEISSLSFEILQSKIEHLFFNNKINYESIDEKRKVIQNLQSVIEDRKGKIKEYIKNVAELYLSYCLLVAKDLPGILDNLLWLYNINSNSTNPIETKFAFKSIILSLEKNFFMYYTNKFIDTINYQTHQKFLANFQHFSSFNFKQIPIAKLEFLLDECRQKLLEFVNVSITFEKTIRNILAEIDIDYLYLLFSKNRTLSLTNYLSLEPDIFSSQNFLTIMYQLGLLNYEI